jgi:hypothetical protein
MGTAAAEDSARRLTQAVAGVRKVLPAVTEFAHQYDAVEPVGNLATLNACEIPPLPSLLRYVKRATPRSTHDILEDVR